jgi:NOL1/NOP2/sun family putative RNA methylase
MLPKLLDSRLHTILDNDYDSVMQVFATEKKWSLRLNLLKWDGSEVFAEFEKKSIKIVPYENLPGVYFFDRDQEYAIKGTDAFYQGYIYLQSLASMLPAYVLDPESWDAVLDVCAAPWSKTTQIAMMMENDGEIVALEQNPIRYDKLMHNCRLQWATIVAGRRIDARMYLGPMENTTFDRILLDAQCSAEGRISLANEKTYGFWSLENTKKKAEVQYELLSLALGRLKSWGTLVYSTCTLAPEENEWVITRALEKYPDVTLESIDIGLGEKSWWREGITVFGSQRYSEEVKKAVRILPSDETEGFFIAKIVKR